MKRLKLHLSGSGFTPSIMMTHWLGYWLLCLSNRWTHEGRYIKPMKLQFATIATEKPEISLLMTAVKWWWYTPLDREKHLIEPSQLYHVGKIRSLCCLFVISTGNCKKDATKQSSYFILEWTLPCYLSSVCLPSAQTSVLAKVCHIGQFKHRKLSKRGFDHIKRWSVSIWL